jgi:hypothetical protein
MLVTEEARRPPISSRAALVLIVAVIAAGFMWVLISSAASNSVTGSHSTRVQRAAAPQGRVAIAAQAWAVAIERAWRDRGTDAELQDTIPPPPRS